MLRHPVFSVLFCSCFAALLGVCTFAQNEAPAKTNEDSLAETVRQLANEVQQLKLSIAELRTESDRFRAETRELRRELDATNSPGGKRNELEKVDVASSGERQSNTVVDDQAPSTSPVSDRVAKLEDEYRLLTGKVDDQYQTKVESGSKYRVRLSGIALLNLFSNRGTLDTIDVPQRAEPLAPVFGGGSFGETLRQSQIGVEVFGPIWAGAKVSGNLRFDFAGGFPDTQNGVSLGLARLRTGGIRLEWPRTTIVAGQEAPFFSPLSPTSIATLAEPAFSYAGNLWTWVPQLRVEHSLALSSGSSLFFQGGIIDPLTGEPPGAQSERRPQAGEASRQPGYAGRIAWRRADEDHAFDIGFGGYYSRENWGFARNVNGWATTLDAIVPLGRRFEARGELYRGTALGGLGASGAHSIVASDILNNPQTVLQGLDSAGGWGQLKFRATSVLEFNAAYGEDNPSASALRRFAAVQNLLDPELGKNRSGLLNFIYHPRSDLVFSLEYRHLRSFRALNDNRSAEHINMGIGILF